MGYLRLISKLGSELSSCCLTTNARVGGLVKLMSSSARVPYSAGKRSIPKVDKVLLVASGKGGVGKSTTAGVHIPTMQARFNCHSMQVNHSPI